MDARAMFRCLIPVLWLRPESALWYAHTLTLAKEYLGRLDAPTLEFGCMDGVNSLILLDGKFDDRFDVYNEVQWDKDSHKRSTLSNDYFDTFDESEKVLIERQPFHQFDLGVDWKDSHISKCRRLGIYKNLQKVDFDNPVIQAPDNMFSTIWAPNIYWMRNLDSVIAELARVLSASGKLVTVGPGPMQPEYMFYKYVNSTNKKWLQNLDRGRYENTKASSKSFMEWQSLFKSHGLEITRHETYIPEIVAKTYDIGFRPMFPVFMNMYDTLKHSCAEDLLDLKKQWVATVCGLLEPLCVTDWMDDKYPDAEKASFIFELRKK